MTTVSDMRWERERKHNLGWQDGSTTFTIPAGAGWRRSRPCCFSDCSDCSDWPCPTRTPCDCLQR